MIDKQVFRMELYNKYCGSFVHYIYFHVKATELKLHPVDLLATRLACFHSSPPW